MKHVERYQSQRSRRTAHWRNRLLGAMFVSLSILGSIFPSMANAVTFDLTSPVVGQMYDTRFNVAGSATADEGKTISYTAIYIDGSLYTTGKVCHDNTTCSTDFQAQNPTSPLIDARHGAHNMYILARQLDPVTGQLTDFMSPPYPFSVDRTPTITSATVAAEGNNLVIRGTAIFKGAPGYMKYTFGYPTGNGYSTSTCSTSPCNFALSSIVNPGPYTIGITAHVDWAPEVSVERKIDFNYMSTAQNVDSTPGSGPSFKVCGRSTFNIATGNVAHDQKLFSMPTGPMAQDFSLFYNSRDVLEVPAVNNQLPLGQGWSHTYDISLFFNSWDNSVVLHGGGLDRKIYTPVNGAYQSQRGDTSTLVKDGATGNYTITHIDGLIYNFNSLGHLTSIVDRYGNRTTVSDKVGETQTVTDPSGRITRLTYDYYTHSKIVSIRDPDLNYYYFTYDAATGLLTQVQYPAPSAGAASPTWTYDYNDMHLLQYKTNPEQQIVKYVYDANGVLTSAINPDGVIDKNSNETPEGHSRTLDISSGTTVYTYENGATWTYTYDAANNHVLSKTDPLGNTTAYSYDAQGFLASKVEPVDATTKFTTTYLYDSHGNITDEAGFSTHYQYDPAGNVLSSSADAPIMHMGYEYDYANYDQIKKVTNLLESPNTVTTYAYDTDSEGYLRTTITDPSGYQTVIRRYSNGNMLDQTYPNGQKLTYAYDAQGILQSVTNASGVKLLFENYDKKGNPRSSKIVDANQVVRQTTTLDYDTLGRNTKNTVAGALTSYITQYGYDKKGNVVSVTDPETNTTSMTYTFQNQVTSQTNALTQTTTIEHGSTCTACGGVDKVTAVIDANQHKNSFEYDLASNLKKETDANGKSVSYEYYPSGRVSKKLDGAGNTLITYTYDGLGRLTRRDYNDADHTWDAFTYGANGLVATAANPNISYTYEYYPNGWLKKVTDSLGRVISYDEYNGAGQRKKVTVQPGSVDQKVMNYDYDTKGRLSTVTSAAGSFTFGYDELGRRSTLTYPNGITVSYTFHQDQPAWLTGVKYQGTSSTLLDVAYTAFDKVGNRKAKVQDAVTANFAYDLVYRLLTVTASTSETYQYDAAGNMTVGPLSTQTRYLYDAANQQTSNPTWVATYDDFGNLKTAGVWTYGWNPAGQLIKSTGDVREVTYKYDPFGRRIERNWREYNSYNYVYTYLYDGDDVVMSWKKDANTGSTLETNHYVHGPGVDEHLAVTRGTTPYFYLADGNNNILKVAKQDQSIAQTYTYDSYGVYTNGLTFDQPYQMAGRELDRDTYLYYNRARYYSPRSKRFISRDPIGFAGGDVVQYGYVGGNPVNFIDPSGYELKYAGFNSKKMLSPSIEQIQTTPAGRTLIGKLQSSRNRYVIHAAAGPRGRAYQEGLHVYVDPSYHPPLDTGCGEEKFSTTRILAHELGHLAGASDDGVDNMNNVNTWENPIMEPLEGYRRVSY